MSLCNICESRYCVDPKDKSPSLAEIAILKYLPKHENIVEYVESWVDDDHFYLVTNLGGYPWETGLDKDQPVFVDSQEFDPCQSSDRSLAGLLRSCGGLSSRGKGKICAPIVKPSIQKKIFSQIVSAIALLHGMGIFHCDLKDEVSFYKLDHDNFLEHSRGRESPHSTN